MVLISRFRSVWGIDSGPGLSNWRKLLVEWKAHGYSGIEVSINFAAGCVEQLQALRKLCDEVDFEVAVVMFSSMPQNAGLAPCGLPPDEHLKFYREQLRLANVLKPTVITSQSGSDYWTLEEAVYFYRMSLQVDKEEGLQGKVGHETHRKRGLFSPRIASLILKHVPELKVTADISHWVLVCERLLIQEEDQNSLNMLIPHVHHIHTRMGTTQSSQCPEPLNPAFAAERKFFEGFWIDIIKAKQREDPDCRITWVPEYGPFPYHPIGSVRTHGEVADSEGKRLEELFDSV